MSDGDAERRNQIIKRLETLQYVQRVESIWLFEETDTTGKSVIRITASPLPGDFDFEERRELWQLSAPLVRDGIFDESVDDGGLLRWLFARSQSFSIPAGGSSRLANPFKVWIDAVRDPNWGGIGVRSENLVPGDPRIATADDIVAVTAKARLLVSVLRHTHENIQRLERSIQEGQKFIARSPDSEISEYLKMDLHSLRVAKWDWCHWCIYADVVSHYSSALIPDDLAKCRQVSRRTWGRPQDVDWPALEQELDLLAYKLQWFEPKPIVKTHRATAFHGEQIEVDIEAPPSVRILRPHPASADNDSGQFSNLILNDTLLGVMNALDGKALRVEKLAGKVTGGDTSRLYRDGLKTSLEANGMIVHDPKIGWYRPDKPPKERVANPAKKVRKSSE